MRDQPVPEAQNGRVGDEVEVINEDGEVLVDGGKLGDEGIEIAIVVNNGI